MAYLVRIGHIPENKSGVGTRGYYIRRRGTHVVTRWGAVLVDPRKRFYWVHVPREKIHRCDTVGGAIAFVAKKLAELEDSVGYSRLPAGCKIRPRS